MSPASPAPHEKARRYAAIVLQRVQRDAKQAALAVAMGTSDSTISRLLSEHLDRLCLVIAHAGLKVVPEEMKCFPPEEVQALLTLARGRLAQVENVEQLSWD